MTEENTIITQEFTIPPRRKKSTRIEINGIVFNNFLEMVEWISTAAKQIEKMKCCFNCSKYDCGQCEITNDFMTLDSICGKWECVCD